jgi:hypothetical protein
MEFGLNFFKWGVWLLLSFEKKKGHLKEKREKKKNNNIENIYSV